jgi:hypothetical protein
MNNSLTINKFAAIFRDMSVRHKMISDFGFGSSWDSQPDNRKFPYFYVEPVSSTIIASTNNASGHLTEQYTFRLSVMDRINKGDSNYIDLLSDMDYVLKTIVAEIDQHVYYVDMDCRIFGNITFTPVFEANSDDVNGFQCDLTIQLPMRFNPCNSPILPITGYTASLSSNITE